MPLFAWFARARQPSEARRRGRPPVRRRRATCAAAIAGITCYYVGALVDFWALTLIDASIERVLLFSYPAIVVLIGSVLNAARAARRGVVAALVVTYAGIFFAMGGVDLAELRQNLFGAGSCSIAALTTAIYFLIGERYTHELGSTRFAAIGMSSAGRDAGAALRRCSAPFDEMPRAAGLRLDAARHPGRLLRVHPRAAAGRGHAARRRAARGHRQHHRPAAPPSCWRRCSSTNA